MKAEKFKSFIQSVTPYICSIYCNNEYINGISNTQTNKLTLDKCFFIKTEQLSTCLHAPSYKFRKNVCIANTTIPTLKVSISSFGFPKILNVFFL